MKLLKIAAVLAALSFVACPLVSAHAGATDPLFVNVTTDDAHRANMALTFSKSQFARKHPVTIFLNDRAVTIASRANSERFKIHQEMLTAFVKDGATVIDRRRAVPGRNEDVELVNPASPAAACVRRVIRCAPAAAPRFPKRKRGALHPSGSRTRRLYPTSSFV